MNNQEECDYVRSLEKGFERDTMKNDRLTQGGPFNSRTGPRKEFGEVVKTFKGESENNTKVSNVKYPKGNNLAQNIQSGSTYDQERLYRHANSDTSSVRDRIQRGISVGRQSSREGDIGLNRSPGEISVFKHENAPSGCDESRSLLRNGSLLLHMLKDGAGHATENCSSQVNIGNETYYQTYLVPSQCNNVSSLGPSSQDSEHQLQPVKFYHSQLPAPANYITSETEFCHAPRNPENKFCDEANTLSSQEKQGPNFPTRNVCEVNNCHEAQSDSSGNDPPSDAFTWSQTKDFDDFIDEKAFCHGTQMDSEQQNVDVDGADGLRKDHKTRNKSVSLDFPMTRLSHLRLLDVFFIIVIVILCASNYNLHKRVTVLEQTCKRNVGSPSVHAETNSEKFLLAVHEEESSGRSNRDQGIFSDKKPPLTISGMESRDWDSSQRESATYDEDIGGLETDKHPHRSLSGFPNTANSNSSRSSGYSHGLVRTSSLHWQTTQSVKLRKKRATKNDAKKICTTEDQLHRICDRQCAKNCKFHRPQSANYIGEFFEHFDYTETFNSKNCLENTKWGEHHRNEACKHATIRFRNKVSLPFFTSIPGGRKRRRSPVTQKSGNKTHGVFQVRTPGVYFIQFNITIVDETGKHHLALHQNGQAMFACQGGGFDCPHRNHHGAENHRICNIQGMLELKKGDTVEIRTMYPNTTVRLEPGKSPILRFFLLERYKVPKSQRKRGKKTKKTKNRN